MRRHGLAHDHHAALVVDLIKTRRLEQWNAWSVSRNCPCIERVMVLLPEFPWHPRMLALNPEMSLAHFTAFTPDYGKYLGLRRMSDVSMDFIIRSTVEDGQEWNWYHISHNEAIVDSYDVVERHSDMPWDCCGLMLNNRVNSDPRIIGLLEERHAAGDLSNRTWRMLTQFAPLPIMEATKDRLPWNDVGLEYKRVVSRPLPVERCHWQWVIPIDIIVKNPAGVRFSEVRDVILARLGRNAMAESTAMTTTDPVEATIPWKWTVISIRSDVTPQIIAQHPDLPWDREANRKEHPTPDDMRTMPGDWMPYQTDHVMSRLFGFRDEVESFARRHMAAYRIQRAYLRAYYDPSMLLCHRRIRAWASDPST
jgi:hypothetical protein